MRWLSKQVRSIASVGLNPKNWVFEIMAAYLSKVKGHTPAIIFKNAKPIDPSLFSLDSTANQLQIETTLKQYGVCVLNNFITDTDALASGVEVEGFIDEGLASLDTLQNQAGHTEHNNIVWQTDYTWSDDYLKIARHTKPVVSIRSLKEGVDDSGMIDVFNINKINEAHIWPNLSKAMSAILQSNAKLAIENISGHKQQQSNIYINRGIKQTRGPHIDSNNNTYKLFIYLTDVETSNDGPYCYLPGTHLKRPWMSYERLKNAILGLPSTETSSIKRNSLTQIRGKAGTAIISCQSGVHSGWPQASDARRLVLVANFY